VPGQVFGPPDVQNLLEFGYKFCRCSSAFRRLLEHTFFITVATVTAVWEPLTCGVRRIAENQNSKRFAGLATGSDSEDYNFLILIIKFID
jgi:hypothetical protein